MGWAKARHTWYLSMKQGRFKASIHRVQFTNYLIVSVGKVEIDTKPSRKLGNYPFAVKTGKNWFANPLLSQLLSPREG